uniref:G_PROTEIN_RECEP_F1_2 domain-containing protein n=2 Tax=Bursaphelenchus xylophilus TaxID=6326 RepID=A0A1I7S207_BURXY
MTDNLFFLSMENHTFSTENDRLVAFLAFTFCGFLQLLLLNIAIHFYYRYNVVRFSNYCSKTKFLLLYGACSLWVVLYFVTAQIEIRPASNYIDALYTIPDFETNPPMVYVFDLNYWSSILTTLDFQLTGMAFYIVGGYFGFKIVKELRRLKASARKAMDAQRYMVRVLIVQAIYPLLVLLLPSTIMVSLFFLHKTFVPFCFVMGLSVQSLPILNAISVLLLVPCYRKLITGSKVSSLNTTPSIKSPKSLLFFK